MAENQKYYLAMYDIRGKQEFIFRTNHIKEIVGGSCIIRDCFEDYLYPMAIAYRNTLEDYAHSEKDAIYRYMEKDANNEIRMKQGADGVFDIAAFTDRMNGKQYLGEVVYDGGGNFLVLYKNEEAFKAINKSFTAKVLEEIGTLKVLCTGISVGKKLIGRNFEADRAELYKKHAGYEATETVIRPTAMLPFTQIDPQTSMPLVDIYVEGNKKRFRKVSRESLKKLEKYKEECAARGIKYGETYLDYLVKEKGEDSMLAVIFIDGNNMGAQVQALLEPVAKDYASCINTLRSFSNDIQRNYVTNRVRDIENILWDRHPEDRYFKHRMIVFAGDEMSFIVRAEDAWAAVKAYFDGMKKVNEENKERIQNGETGYCSSCAGIALFHSHAPYAEAYAIADQCCENAKTFMKSVIEDNKDEEDKDKKEKNENDKEKEEWQHTCLVDFHYCQGGLGMDLKTIRKREVGELISKPWVWLDPLNETGKYPKTVTVSKVEEICADLNKLDSRTNVKGLAMAAMESESALYEELARIKARQTDPKMRDLKLFELEGESGRNLLYDIVTVYDQWFRKPVAKDQGNDKEDDQDA